MSERKFWIAFNKVKGIGPAKVRALLDHFGDLATAWHAERRAWHEAGLDKRAIESLEAAQRGLDLEALEEQVLLAQARLLCWDDDAYPRRLREIDHAPPVLYVRGEFKPNDEWAVAIVGTRHASAYGKEVARDLASTLAAAGVTIVSGLARGIDAVSHAAALDAGGRTIAVLGSGVDVIYPPEHRALVDRILNRGVVLSDYPIGTQPEANNFPPRNRLISGLSLGVIIVEAGEESGALITADYANEQGREVFAVPGSILARNSKGPHKLIQQGAKLITSAEEVLEELNLRLAAHQAQARVQLPLFAQTDETEKKILAQLSQEPLHADELCVLLSMPIANLSSTLALMELKGLVRQVGGMTYVAAREVRANYKVE